MFFKDSCRKIKNGKGVFYMKAIVFDFDGTIANTLPVMFHSFRQVFKTYDNKEYSDEEIKNMFGPPEPDLIKQNLNSEQKEEAIELYYWEYNNHHNQLVEENKAINDMLATLKNKGYKLGIVTGKSKKSFNISLEKLDMDDYFDVTITGYDVNRAKPDPEGLFKALTELNVRPEDSLYIGDSDNDILAAKEANVPVAGAQWLPEYETSEYSQEPDAVFEQPSELINYLEQKKD